MNFDEIFFLGPHYGTLYIGKKRFWDLSLSFEFKVIQVLSFDSS